MVPASSFWTGWDHDFLKSSGVSDGYTVLGRPQHVLLPVAAFLHYFNEQPPHNAVCHSFGTALNPLDNRTPAIGVVQVIHGIGQDANLIETPFHAASPLLPQSARC